jgi:hypothetical protein
VTIFIRTSGGGGIVLLVVLALVFGRGGNGISGALAVVLAVLVALTVLAVIVTLAVIVRRVLPARTPDGPRSVIRVSPEPGELAAPPRALSAPVRLPQDQLEQLAELIRRGQRPEH